MESVQQAVKPKRTYKTFTYQTQLQWVGDKAGILQSGEKPNFRIASPPEFKGEAGVWTPEDLYVAAIDSCVLMTFSTFARHNNLSILSYTSDAEGFLEFVDGNYRFTKVILRPKIALKHADEIELAKKTLHDAHQKCLISNSICTKVIIEPVIKNSNGQ